jgi:hypothetical protein
LQQEQLWSRGQTVVGLCRCLIRGSARNSVHTFARLVSSCMLKLNSK